MTQADASSPMWEGLAPLPIPVPPSLESAVGYKGEGRFLALWWEPAGDEVTWSDGRTTATGWWYGYLAYVQHPKVAPYLTMYELGSSEEPALHRLLLDLVERQAYIGTATRVALFLRQNVPRANLTLEQAERFADAIAQRPWAVDPDAVQRELQFRSLAVDALLEELESHPSL